MPDRLDWFSATILTGEAGLDDRTREVMTSHAEMFLRSRGSVSWSEWHLLGEASRAAFLLAAENIERIVGAEIDPRVADEKNVNTAD